MQLTEHGSMELLQQLKSYVLELHKTGSKYDSSDSLPSNRQFALELHKLASRLENLVNKSVGIRLALDIDFGSEPVLISPNLKQYKPEDIAATTAWQTYGSCSCEPSNRLQDCPYCILYSKTLDQLTNVSDNLSTEAAALKAASQNCKDKSLPLASSIISTKF